MVFALILLVLVPIAELYVLIEVGGAIGALPAIGLLLLTSVLGAVLLRMQGRLAWRRLREALAAGRTPAREVFDGALVVAGAMLLIAPGFVTDALGLLLLLPPVRMLARRALMSRGAGRMLSAASLRSARRGAERGAGRGRARQDYDVESTAHDVDAHRLGG